MYGALDPGVAGAGARDTACALAAALRHPAFTWVVGGRVSGLFRAAGRCRRAALRAALSGPDAIFPDRSRVGGTVQVLCDEPDDALAVPALRELLRRFGRSAVGPARERIAGTPRPRAKAWKILPMPLPPDADDRHPDPQSSRREMAWKMARELDWPATRRLLDAMFRRRSRPTGRLMGVWRQRRGGLGARLVRRACRRRGRQEIPADPDHARARYRLHHYARHALYGGVFDTDDDDVAAPWTLASYERAFSSAGRGLVLRRTRPRKGQRTQSARPARRYRRRRPAAALRHADAWVQRSLQDQALAADQKADRLAEGFEGWRAAAARRRGRVNPTCAFTGAKSKRGHRTAEPAPDRASAPLQPASRVSAFAAAGCAALPTASAVMLTMRRTVAEGVRM